MPLTNACGIVIVSNVGSAPLFALKNLPSLDDVPCSSLAKDIESSASLDPAIFAVALKLLSTIVPAVNFSAPILAFSHLAPLIAPSTICDLVTALSAIFGSVIASSCILAVSTAFDCKLPAPTELLASFAFVTAPAPNSFTVTALFAIFCVVTASSAIFVVVTASVAIFASVTALFAILVVVTASVAILASITDEFCNIEELTVLLLGVPILTVEPITTA